MLKVLAELLRNSDALTLPGRFEPADFLKFHRGSWFTTELKATELDVYVLANLIASTQFN